MTLFRAHTFNDKPFKKGCFSNPYWLHERRPLNTHIESHDIANKWFLEKFGIKFRSHSLFCTGNREVANQYRGIDNEYTKLISIAPVGYYKVCYSKKCDDFYTHLNCLLMGHKEENLQELIFEMLESYDFEVSYNSGLTEAAESGCEVMLYSEKFKYKIIN